MQIAELARLSLAFDPRLDFIGPAPDAMHFHCSLQAGIMHGSGIDAHALRCGGEWSTIRGDGLVVSHAKCILEIEPFTLIFVNYVGMSNVGEIGYDAFLDGEPPSSASVDFSLNFQAAAGDLRWLNRLHCFGSGTRDYRRFTFEMPLLHFEHDVQPDEA